MELKNGASIEFQPRPAITKEQLRAYADASGDHNSIHLDESAARKAGLPGIIAHGMLSAAFLADRAVGFMAGQGKWKLDRFQTR